MNTSDYHGDAQYLDFEDELFDSETDNYFRLTVQAQDSYKSPLSDAAYVYVHILNVWEAPALDSEVVSYNENDDSCTKSSPCLLAELRSEGERRVFVCV